MTFAAQYQHHKANAQMLIMCPESFKTEKDVDVNKVHIAKGVTSWFAVHANVTKTIHYAFAFIAQVLWRI